MTPQDLIDRLNAQEDSFIERKSQGIKPHDLRKALTAFANSLPDSEHGVIYIGIGDKGNVEGCENTDAVQKRVRQAADECYPPIAYQCVALTVDGKHLVAIIVSANKDKPHFAGPAYVRQGSESLKASKGLFEEMVNARHSKVAAILAMRTAMAVTVIGLGHRLGGTRRDVDRGYREGAECKVIACDAHEVTLLQLNTGRTFSEAIERVEVGTDHDKYRPRLTVRSL